MAARKKNLSVFQGISTKQLTIVNDSAVWLNYIDPTLCLSLKLCFCLEWNSSLCIYVCMIGHIVIVPRTSKKKIASSNLSIHILKIFFIVSNSCENCISHLGPLCFNFHLMPLQSRWRMLIRMLFFWEINTEPLCIDWLLLSNWW